MIEVRETITWNNADVEVNFTFSAGYEAKIFGLPENCYPGEPDEYEITAIIYQGVDVLPLFSDSDYDHVIAELERIRECDDDY